VANFHYRLLVIDDEPLSRELLQSSLSTHGYEACLAKDGFAALAQMRGALPDLIVSDLKMPNMSGFEFLSIARRRFPQIPTIAVSGEFHLLSNRSACSQMLSLPNRLGLMSCWQKLRTCCVTLRRDQQLRGTERRSGCPAMESTT
jgi:CheY-like chemotaxis protein